MYQFKLEGFGFYKITAVADNIFKVVFSKNEIENTKSLLVEEANLRDDELTVDETSDKLEIKNDRIQLNVDKETGKFTWYQVSTGEKYLTEGEKTLIEKDLVRYQLNGDKPIVKRVKTVDGERNFIENLEQVMDGTAYRGKINFEWEPEEGIYGLGQAEEGIYNYRGHVQYLYQHNMRIPMPMLISSKKYGIFVDCCSLMTFNDNENGSYLFLDTVKQMEYYFVAGEDFNEITRGFRTLTGSAQMLPKWAFGYIQSRETYCTQQELEDIVAEYRKRNVPLDCVVQDWKTWEPGNWGEKIVDKKRYPDLSKAMQHIHDMHAHAMVSMWPNMNHDGENYAELDEKGHMLMDLATYDAFNEEAREIYWQQVNRELFSGGFDAWWCDSTEPFSGPDWGGEEKREPWERYEMVGQEHQKFLGAERANAFAMMHARGIYENQRKTSEEKRVLNLTRSGYPSIQKYGAVLWSGDTCATWKTLKDQITEGLNMAMSGYPYWTLDIGAFFTLHKNWQKRGCDCEKDPTMKWFWQGDYEEGVNDLAYRELYTRWLQFGTFLPMFRSHGTDTPREIWNFGEPGTPFYDAIEKFINLRYTLMPYIYSMAAKIHFENATMMRSLAFDFLADEKVKDIHDEFLFGDAFLICPVIEPMYYEVGSKPIEKEKTRSCYLPAGTKWFDFWTNTCYEGGQTVVMNAELDKIPVFVKAGSIIPVSEGIQYATEQKEGKRQIWVYPGADAKFSLYEDEGDNYNFEKGMYALTEMIWDDAAQKMTIGKTQGGFPGMEENPEYEIIVK